LLCLRPDGIGIAGRAGVNWLLTSRPRSVDDELCACVLAYLTEHPEAMDTPEGIADWWIQRARIRTEVHRVHRALRRLCTLGVLEEVETETACFYRLRRPGNGS
jgi:hypothetical protein